MAIKEAWWNQLFSSSTRERFPNLKMINWFEWDKNEIEVKGRVDWTVTNNPAVRDAFTAALAPLRTHTNLPTPTIATHTPGRRSNQVGKYPPAAFRFQGCGIPKLRPYSRQPTGGGILWHCHLLSGAETVPS